MTTTTHRHGIVRIDPDVLMSLAGHKAVKRKIAPGFKARKSLNMKAMGGKTIKNLSFRSFYIAGPSWAASDMTNIDTALSGAMADPHLNNVLLQYYPGRRRSRPRSWAPRPCRAPLRRRSRATTSILCWPV